MDLEKAESKNRTIIIALIIGLLAFAYYATMSAKEWTWTFVSFDSGDWLAASTIWMVPQPYGSPLYILLGHFLNLFPGDLAIKMTFVLSVLPSAITVGLVYLIITKLGLNSKLALAGSVILLSCGIFLSQSTVLEEYALTAMFVTLAFYCYVSNKRLLTMLFLGLGTAVHIIVAPITFLWLAVNFKEWRKWVKPTLAVYLPVTVAFYSFILFLMWADTPKFLAGNLSLQSINAYLGSTGTIGRISLVEAPHRLYEAATIILLGFGAAVIPLWYGLRRAWNPLTKVMIVTIAFCLWLYITNTDMTTWTFLVFGLPIAAVAIAIGLSKMPKWYFGVTLSCALALIVANSLMLNADVLSNKYSEAKSYYQSVQAIPDNSAVVLPKGGAYGLGLINAIAQGQKLTPIFLQKEEGWTNQGYLDYVNWISTHSGIQGQNWIEQINFCLDHSKTVYVGYTVQPPEWQEEIDRLYETTGYNTYFREVTGKK